MRLREVDLYIQGDNKWRYADTEEKEEEVCVWRIHVTWLQTRETSIDLIVPAKVLSSWFVKIRTINRIPSMKNSNIYPHRST